MPILDPTSFTTPRELLGLYAYMGTQKRVQSRGAVRKYVAKALTDSVPLSLANLMSGKFEHRGGEKKVSRYILRAKIQSALYNHKDPHAMLPDPCLPIYASKPNEAIALIKLHSLCITSKGFELANSEQINKGDIIEISCKIDRQTGQPMVGFVTITKIMKRAPPVTASETQHCIDLAGKFDYTSVSLGDSGADRAKRQVKIDALWGAIVAHGNVPAGVSITSTGRSIAEGRAMIVRMAKIVALEAIGAALQKFKDDEGDKGYAALVAAGTIESFANTSFAPPGWKLESPPKYKNNAVHIEIVGS